MSNKSQVGVHGSEELANLPDRNTVKSQTGGHDKPSTISLGDPIYPHNGPFAHGGPAGDMQRDGMITKEQQRKMIGQSIAANHMTQHNHGRLRVGSWFPKSKRLRKDQKM